MLQQARRAESLGFDSLWVGDHVAFHVPILESLSLLAFLAGATERVVLGTAVYLLPLRHPALAAKTAATVDLLSGGRLVFGVGVGGEFPPEFDASAVPVAERGARIDEAIPLLRRLWTEGAVKHEGRFHRFGPIDIQPKPVQAGGPPIWIGGRAPAAMRRAGRLGDGYVSTMTSPERYRANLEAIAAAAGAAGRSADCFVRPFGTGALLFTVLDASFEAAHGRAAKLLGQIYARDFSDAAKRYCLLGRPDDVLAQLRAFADAGLRHAVLAPLMDPSEFTERVGEEILPRLRQIL